MNISPYQIWKVTSFDAFTCSSKTLGYYEGYLDTIAFQLGGHSSYLYFEPVVPKSVGVVEDPAYEVIVSMDRIDPDYTEAEVLKDMLSSRQGAMFEIQDTGDLHSVKLVRTLSPKEKAKKELDELLGTTSEDAQKRVFKLMKEVYET